MGKQAPAPGNYTQAAENQAATSQHNVQQQTQANRPDINGTFTTQNWVQGPDGQWTLNSGLTGGLGSAAATLGNTAAANAQRGIGTGEQARDQAISAAYNQASKRLAPQFEMRHNQLSQQLANQGLDPNSEAARNAQRELDTQENDAYGSAMNSAIGQGTEAGQAIFNQNLAGQMAPYQQMGMLNGLGQTPQFHAAGMADPTQYLNATAGQFGANMRQWNAQNQANADAIRGGAQLAMVPFSFI